MTALSPQRLARIGVLAALFCSAAASSKRLQFDLICPTYSRTVKANNPERIGYVSYSGPSKYYSVERFSFDLGRGVYRNRAWRDGVFQSIRIGRGSVLLAKDSDSYSRFDLRANRYFSRQTADARRDEIETAHCRRVAFSGIGAFGVGQK